MTTIVVSNRLAQQSQTGAMPGGLAAALLPAVEKSGAIWFGGSGNLLTAPSGRPVTEVSTLGAGKLVKVDFPRDAYNRFYNGMANAALWPVLHYRADLLRYEAADFEAYIAINATMADSICAVLRDNAHIAEDPTIWVHDYHFFPLGRCLRQRGVDGPLGFFLHTPFPTSSVVVCLPEHRDVFEALSAYDVVGFQTEDDLARFRDYAKHELSATVISANELRFGGRRVRLGAFPIGIDVERFAPPAAPEHEAIELTRLKRSLHDATLVIGVDRLDYSKGLIQRFRAYQTFLTNYAEERRRVSFLQITPPTRSEVDAYQDIRAEISRIAGDINARFSSVDWVALRYINEGFPPDTLATYYRLSKVGCVTPLRDGMNLVAKEYIAAQEPKDPGVLVLSKFAGAAKEMGAALLVNPYNAEGVAKVLHRALHMRREERVERWSELMRGLRENSLQRWFDGFLAALNNRPVSAPPLSLADHRLAQRLKGAPGLKGASALAERRSDGAPASISAVPALSRPYVP